MQVDTTSERGGCFATRRQASEAAMGCERRSVGTVSGRPITETFTDPLLSQSVSLTFLRKPPEYIECDPHINFSLK
jgi:hypothetical protein